MSGEMNPVMPMPSSSITSEATEKTPELIEAEQALDDAVDSFAKAAAAFQEAGGNPMEVFTKFQQRFGA